MRKIPMALSLIFCLALALPVAVAARGHHHGGGCPGGNSAVDEYVECVPGSGGHHPSGRHHPGSNPGGGASNLSPSAQQALAGKGSAGQAVANLAQATGPARGGANGNGGGKAGASNKNGKHGNGGSSASGGTGSSASSSRSGLDSVSDTLTGSGSGNGMGILLPILLLAGLLGAIALVVRRRLRSRSAHRA